MKSSSGSVNADTEETDRLLETPHADRPKSSEFQAFFNTVKSFVGVGILEFPYAVKHSGLWAGIVLLFLIGVASNYTIKVLIRCKQELVMREKVLAHTKEITFGDVGQYTFGSIGKYAVNFAIISSQIGFCCAYVMFIAKNLNSMIPHIPVAVFSIIYFPVFMLLSWLRNIKYLAPTSVFANFSLLFAATVILYYGFSHIVWEHHYPALNVSGVPTFFGIAVFGFEGINLALPIHASMKNPKRYGRVLDIALVVVGTMYIAFGSLGYICFGEKTQSIITLNLPGSAAIVYVVKVALILELTFSYPIQLFPVSTICEAGMFSENAPNKLVMSSLFRTALVALTVGIAIIIPHFDLFTALIGAFSNSLVTFIFPPIFLLALFKRKLQYYEIALNILMLVLGLIASGISSYMALHDIIRTFFK